MLTTAGKPLLPSRTVTPRTSTITVNPTKGPDMIATLLEAENQLTRGERVGDRDLLSKLLSESFVGVDLRGQRYGKRDFIARFCDSGLTFSRLEIEDLEVVDLEASNRIVIGRSVFCVAVSGRIVDGSARFMDCWKHTNGQWTLITSSVTPEQKTAQPGAKAQSHG